MFGMLTLHTSSVAANPPLGRNRHDPAWRLGLRVGTSSLLIWVSCILSLVAVTVLFDMSGVIADVAIYFRYADRTFSGAIPYRDFPIEYPFLALPFFLVPRLFTQTELSYAALFALEMLVINACLMWLVFREVEKRAGAVAARRTLNWYVLCVAVLAPMALGRYDLAPALLAFAAGLSLVRQSYARAGVFAAVGFLVKLFPALVLAPAVASCGFKREYRNWRTLAVALLTALLGFAVWFLIGGSGVITSIAYHAARGLEIESLYSGLLMGIAVVRGATQQYAFRFGSIELVSESSAAVAAVVPMLQLLVLGAVAVAVRRSAPDLFRSVAAFILAFIVSGKVLSPQYVIWLLPFAACWSGPRADQQRWLLFAIALLTTAIHPWIWFALLRFEWWAVLVLNLRNAALLALLCWLLLTPPPQAALNAAD